MLFSAGKDSTVLAYLALRAFYPAPPPFPLPHVDSTWEFRSLLASGTTSPAGTASVWWSTPTRPDEPPA
jgi:hypothetical protein